MLVLTEAAAEVVKSVTSTPQTPEGAGLRIESDAQEPETPGALRVTAALGPSENDQVIETWGARVFLEPQAAAYLEDKVLDARFDEQGEAHFSLGMQADAQSLYRGDTKPAAGGEGRAGDRDAGPAQRRAAHPCTPALNVRAGPVRTARTA